MRQPPEQPSGRAGLTPVLATIVKPFLIAAKPAEKGRGTKYLRIGRHTHTRVYRNHSVQCSRPPGATEWSRREKQKNYWGQHKFCSRPQGSGYHGNSDCSQGYFTWSTYQWRSFILGEFNDPQKTASKLKNYIVLITVLDFHILFSVISWQVIPQDWWPQHK